MWCRLLLVAAAITYVICVLLLSGLQKGDLDSSVLEKLQRRNVNIDDMNNEAIREQCTILSHVKSTTENASPTTKVDSTMRFSYEEPRRLSIVKAYDSEETKQFNALQTERDIYNKSEGSNRIVMKNFVNLYWQMIGKISEKPEITTVSTTTPTSAPLIIKTDKSSDSQKDSLEYINHMLLKYIAAQLPTTTIQPSTTTQETQPQKLQIDMISQKIKELLDKTNNIVTTTSTTDVGVKAYKPLVENVSTHKSVSDYINEYLKLRDNKLSLRSNQNDIKPEEKSMDDKNQIETKLIPDTIIKEITEKVKVSVLEHLQTHVLAPVLENTTTGNKHVNIPEIRTSYTTTTKPTHDQGTKNAEVLENIINLLKHFEIGKDTSTERTISFTQKKGMKNEFHGPINVLYPPLIPMNFPYGINNETHNATPLMAYPFNHLSIINNPVIEKSKPQPRGMNNIQTRFESLANFNLVSSAQKPGPLTIQTDALQIPPLIVNMPNTMSPINQNIVVTTKRPIVNFNEHSYLNMNKREYEPETVTYYYDMVRNNGPKSTHDRYPRREDQTEMWPKYVPRNRPYANYDEFYKDHINTFHGQGKRYNPVDRSKDRFHEILERPDGWQGYGKHKKQPRTSKRLKVTSRQQVALHDLKKRPKYEDAHFRNFLKTQKKVNDMLEKLLAMNTNDDNRRSVEAI